MATSIPIIDFDKYGLHIAETDSVKREDLKVLSDEIFHAFSTTGFCYITNHGFDKQQIDDVLKSSKSFFQSPLEEKRKCARPPKDRDGGYIALTSENLNPDRPVGDYKEAFNYAPSEPDNWPENHQDFREAMTQFFETCKQLTHRLLEVLSICMKLKDQTFLNKCHELMGREGGHAELRSLYYPALPNDGTVKPGQVRCGEHSDYGTITLLFQDDIGGLEVQNRNNEWIAVTPVPGAIIVNIGDLMQRWTSDSLIAAKHRVLIPEEDIKRRQSRQSIAFFVVPDRECLVTCLDGSNKYEPITAKDYLNYRFSLTY